LPGRVKLLPSVPVTITAVAFVVATVRVEAAPAAMEAGVAVMEIVGLAAGPELCETPHPAEIRSREKHVAVAIVLRERGRGLIFSKSPFRVELHSTREPASILDAGMPLLS
jgi:hypothetical protein